MCLVAFQKIFRKIFSGVWKRRRKTQIRKHKPQATTQKKKIINSRNVFSPTTAPWSRSEIAISDRNHGAVVVDDFMYFLGCGLCFLICVFLLLFQTPNTRKYFAENFLKCNQTHGNIFLFRKLAFLENMYFPENVLQQPNTAYMKKSFNFCRKILIGSFSFFIILCSSIFRFETFDM